MLDGRRIEAATTVDDLSRAQRKADGEVEQVRSRRTRDAERLQSGTVANPKDLERLQREITALDRRISTLEDEELEVMEQLETAQAELDGVVAELASLDAHLQGLVDSRDAQVAAIDDEAAAVTAERRTIAAAVAEPLLAVYDKVRHQHGGLGAAALMATRCEGCRLELNAADLRELGALPAEQVLRCPECDRILVRVPESAI